MPKLANNLAALAEKALRAKRASSALPMLQAAINEDGRSARLWTLAGDAWEMTERPDRAEECYRRALTLFPEAEEPRFRLAVALTQQDKRLEARATIDPLAKRQPPYRGAEELLRRLGP
jgi:Tfp pilus assembly protein PilF